MQTFTLLNQEQADKLADVLRAAPKPCTITLKDGEDRTKQQNALLHVWFGDIGKHIGDDAKSVKGMCHHEWGVPIRSRDPQWLFMWEAAKEKVARMTLPPDKTAYEVERSMLSSGHLQVSSGMKIKELSEYLNAVEAYYRPRGVPLTRPEELLA